MLIPAFLASCENPEGIGGTGSISGTVVEYFYNDDYSRLIYQQPVADEEIFILFGDEEAPGERVRTGASGTFMFRYLYPGNYRIYFRSEDSLSVPDDGWMEPLQVTLGNGEDKDLGELRKLSRLDFDDGHATISGVVKKITYANGSVWPNLVVDYVDFAQEQEIYLTYGNHDYFDERIRTGDNGYFEFSDLIPGEYRVFLYSEDVTRETDNVVVEFTVTISTMEQVVDLGEITIEDI